jgi:hypothetical protein
VSSSLASVITTSTSTSGSDGATVTNEVMGRPCGSAMFMMVLPYTTPTFVWKASADVPLSVIPPPTPRRNNTSQSAPLNTPASIQRALLPIQTPTAATTSTVTPTPTSSVVVATTSTATTAMSESPSNSPLNSPASSTAAAAAAGAGTASSSSTKVATTMMINGRVTPPSSPPLRYTPVVVGNMPSLTVITGASAATTPTASPGNTPNSLPHVTITQTGTVVVHPIVPSTSSKAAASSSSSQSNSTAAMAIDDAAPWE